MICDEAIQAYLATIREGFHCRQSSNGRLSILTPYLYPDHDNIEVFVRPKEGEATVSDMGETLRGLDTLGLDIMDTPNSLFAANKIAEGFGVVIERGILVKRGPIDRLGSLIFDVVLACQSVGSLIYGNRAYEPAAFEDEVKEYLEGHGFVVNRNVKEQGITGKKYVVSFRVPTKDRSFFISAISPKSTASIQTRINYNFRMWSDLNGGMTKDKKINLLNDDLLSFKDEDIKILERVSSVYRWTDRQSLATAIRAA